MTELEQQLTDHLRRRADAATPRYDLEGIEQGSGLVSLVDLDDRRPRRPMGRTIVGLAAAVAVVVALAAAVIMSPTDPPATPSDTAELRAGGEVIVFESLGAGAGWDLAAQDPETGEVRKLVATDGMVDCSDAALVEVSSGQPSGRPMVSGSRSVSHRPTSMARRLVRALRRSESGSRAQSVIRGS